MIKFIECIFGSESSMSCQMKTWSRTGGHSPPVAQSTHVWGWSQFRVSPHSLTHHTAIVGQEKKFYKIPPCQSVTTISV